MKKRVVSVSSHGVAQGVSRNVECKHGCAQSSGRECQQVGRGSQIACAIGGK